MTTSALGIGLAETQGVLPVWLAPACGLRVGVVVAGLAAWAFFAFWAHAAWIGVKPFGGAMAPVAG